MASELETAAILNPAIRDVLDFLLDPPSCYAYRGTNQSFTTATWAPLQMANELYDAYATPAHDTSTNNTRLVAAETGLYAITGHLTWAADASGVRFADIRKNAAGVQSGGTELEQISIAAAAAGISTRMVVYVEAQLTAGDYVELFGQQSSGGTLSAIGGQADSFLAFRWVARL